MSYYDYACDKCKIVWEENYSIGKAPKKKKCPECKVKGERYYGEAPALIFKGEGYHTNTLKWRRANTKTDKKDGDEFMNNAINLSKESLNTARTSDFYARYDPSDKTMKEAGMRKLSAKEKSEGNLEGKKLVNEKRSKLK